MVTEQTVVANAVVVEITVARIRRRWVGGEVGEIGPFFQGRRGTKIWAFYVTNREN